MNREQLIAKLKAKGIQFDESLDDAGLRSLLTEKIRTVKMKPISRRALFMPDGIDDEARTIPVVWATDSTVRMNGWDGSYDEILSMDPGHVRMDRLLSGAPVLDNHNRYNGTKGVLGTIDSATLEGGEGRAVLRFSKRKDVDDVWQDVKDGILRGISVGYRVFTYMKEETEGEVPVYRAIDWEPMEISLAPVQADYKAAVRNEGDDENEVEIKGEKPTETPTDQGVGSDRSAKKSKSNIMNREQIIAALKTRGITVKADATDAELQAELERALANPDDIQKAAVAAERKRSADITEAVRKVKLGNEFAATLISEGKTVEEARAAIIDKLAEEDPTQKQRNEVTVGAEESVKIRTAMESAIMLRANPNADLKPEEVTAARDFRGMSLIRMTEFMLSRQGVKTSGMSSREMASMALQIRGMHSTSDFPIILGNTINRVLRQEYALQPRTFLPWCRQTTATDFKAMTKAQFGEVGNFEEVLEGGEYKATPLSEAQESYAVKKYGQKIGVTWETLVNDDLGAFNRIPSKIAAAAARKQSDIIYGILAANPQMGDGVVLFHATHGNAATASIIDIDNLGKARKAMRVQKGLDKKDYLNLTPSFLVVGPAQEQYALQYTSSMYDPNDPTKINPWGKSLTVVVEPRITDNTWYLMAAPSAVDTIEFAFLEGEGELFTEMRESFDTDGLEIKARLVFGAKAIDYRGMVRNTGLLP